MPAFDQAFSDAEIDAIVTYLWDKSVPIKYDPVPGNGDPAAGKELVHTIGCFACHTDEPNETFSDRTQPRAFGPNLAGLGSKTSQAWIFRWLKDPKHYWKATYMPNLRLTDQEALDISAYLVSSRNAEFDKTEAPAAKKQALDWLTAEYLSARMSLLRDYVQYFRQRGVYHIQRYFPIHFLMHRNGCPCLALDLAHDVPNFRIPRV